MPKEPVKTEEGAPRDALLLDASAVARLLMCSKRHLLRLVDAGQFPRPVSVGSKLKRWPRAVVLAWVEARSSAPTGR